MMEHFTDAGAVNRVYFRDSGFGPCRPRTLTTSI